MKSLFFKMVLLTAFLPFFNDTNAQNLVENGSFERHNPIKCIYCEIFYDKFDNLVADWGNMNSGAKLCDCDYKRNEDEIRKGNPCDTDNIKPKSGKAFIEISYDPRCLDDAHETMGFSSYLNTAFENPLTLGKVYEISFWLYIPTMENTDTTFAPNIGITLLPRMIVRPNRAMLHGHDLLIEKVIFDKWYQVKWQIRPTCNLKHLVIGTFRNQNFPLIHEHTLSSLYFIDDVLVEKIAETEIFENSVITPFCKATDEIIENEIVKIDKQILRFETNESLLSDTVKVQLDLFAKAAKAQPKVVFWISGYTDSKGSNHEVLSEARVNSVIQYLNEVHKIPKFRFISTFEGDKNPITSNDTELGRSQNRRVEIKHSIFDLSQNIYHNLIVFNENNNLDSAFILMNIWLHLSEKSQQILTLYDNRLEKMHQDKRWKSVEIRIEKNYLFFENSKYSFELEKLWAADQKYRTLTRHINDLGYVPILKDLSLEKLDFPANLEDLDRNNIQKLKALLHEYSFPKTSEVGKRSAKTAAVILIHSEDSILIKQYLPIMEKYCKEGEADWGYFAMLYDKYCTIRKEPQRYGTQYLSNPKNPTEMLLAKLENPLLINERRKKIGLLPLSLDVIEKALKN